MGDVDYLLIFVLIMLFIIVLMDFVSLGMVKKGAVSIEEYATSVLKWTKIILLGLFSIVMFMYAFSTKESGITLAAELTAGVLLIADAIVGISIKAKYGKKGKRE